MKRTALIVTLFAAYLGVWLHEMAGNERRPGFDPFAPRARTLAQRLGAGQYQDALPIARELDQAFPDEPEVVLALARVWHGLHAWSSEADAWERYVRVSPTPAEARPPARPAVGLKSGFGFTSRMYGLPPGRTRKSTRA